MMLVCEVNQQFRLPRIALELISEHPEINLYHVYIQLYSSPTELQHTRVPSMYLRWCRFAWPWISLVLLILLFHFHYRFIYFPLRASFTNVPKCFRLLIDGLHGWTMVYKNMPLPLNVYIILLSWCQTNGFDNTL